MRLAVLLLTCLLISLMSGCGHAHPCDMGRESVDLAPGAGPSADLAAALLFDRIPGRYTASDFAYRSDWPSTNAYYSPGQVIFFSERFVDHQGRGFGGSDYTYRRFRSHRVGVGFR